MITISISLQKGGTGKTTTTLNLGVALAGKGKRVLMVDLDPQASLTKGVGVETSPQSNATYNLLTGQPTSVFELSEYLSIIPTSLRLASLVKKLFDGVNPSGVLKKALAGYRKDFDVVLLDTPPNLDRLTINALVAADYIIIPCQCQRMAIEGLEDFTDTISEVRELNPGLEILAVLPTMYTANRKVEQEALAVIQETFGELCRPPLPNRVEYLKASAEQRPVSTDLFKYWQDLASYVIEKAGI